MNLSKKSNDIACLHTSLIKTNFSNINIKLTDKKQTPIKFPKTFFFIAFHKPSQKRNWLQFIGAGGLPLINSSSPSLSKLHNLL